MDRIFRDRDDAVKRIVILTVLAGAGEEVITRSPEYLLEKYEALMTTQFPESLVIDDEKRKIVARYALKWAN